MALLFFFRGACCCCCCCDDEDEAVDEVEVDATAALAIAVELLVEIVLGVVAWMTILPVTEDKELFVWRPGNLVVTGGILVIKFWSTLNSATLSNLFNDFFLTKIFSLLLLKESELFFSESMSSFSSLSSLDDEDDLLLLKLTEDFDEVEEDLKQSEIWFRKMWNVF